MSRTVLILLAAVSLGFAPAPFFAPKKLTSAEAELKALQGEWVLSSCTLYGKPEPIRTTVSWVFAGDRLAIYDSGKVESRGKVALDPSKSPKVMDLAGEAPLEILRCRYRLESDTLTLYFGRSQVEVYRRRKR